MLELDHLSKTYGRSSLRAVNDLTLRVNDGEFIALLGSSGCGKTSTLRMIAGFEAVTEGRIALSGRRIDGLAPARRRVAMAFEGYALYPPLTVEDNIGFGLSSKPGLDARQRVRELADLLEIGAILKRKPAGLSGGQQQRASLARALARDAELHLLDEPMGQLEPQLRAILRGRVKALTKARGLTSVLVTHDQTEANAMADRIAVMEGGILQQYGTPAELHEQPANLFVATFFGEPPMNALPAIVDGDGLRLEGDTAARVSLAGLPLPPPGTSVVLGLRPHAVILGQGDWRATVISNHWLGDEAHVALDMNGRLIIAVAHNRVQAQTGSVIPLGFSSRDLHLFDAATGRALLHGSRVASPLSSRT
ncbi:MAG TPA: ABC transporter ATP-binding protein [Acidisoma sp.]|jgi:multiple sugar transport system ATP-binding protein|uniref:ABC transporter ATP-binding protein n=1 Tax=Acidisoma sp. TaxID=1872115 RepID=UPI002BF11B80|nr:ABC transporter ATP-binding protein [Acidisoma sp.]HTH99788.1 ABC transporter ATP-binding protein [Acidisoma sp.]